MRSHDELVHRWQLLATDNLLALELAAGVAGAGDLLRNLGPKRLLGRLLDNDWLVLYLPFCPLSSCSGSDFTSRATADLLLGGGGCKLSSFLAGVTVMWTSIAATPRTVDVVRFRWVSMRHGGWSRPRR